MNATRQKLQNLRRAVRSIPIAGDESITVRDLTLAELRRVEVLADQVDTSERGIRYGVLLAAIALAEPDGSPAFTVGTDDDLIRAALEIEAALTPAQLKAIGEAAVGNPAEAKKN